MTESNFLPKIEVDLALLPSRGLSYPTGSTITYRTYMHGEVREISTSTIGIDNTLKIAMKGVEASFGVDSLTLQDALYIAIMRKISTLNTIKLEVPFVCSKCEETQKMVFTEKDIEFKDISEEIKSLPFYITLADQELQIGPMTVKEYKDLKNGKYSDTIKGGEVDKVAAQAIMVKNLPFEKSYKLLYELTKKEDIQLVADVDKAMFHDLKPLKAICKNEVRGTSCKTQNSIKLGGRDALISPFRDSERTIGTRIRFGPTPKPECATD